MKFKWRWSGDCTL